MASCASCGSSILFGGRREAGLRFCNEKCRGAGQVLVAATHLPTDVVSSAARDVHAGLCPECGGSGPVDVHVSHQVWSAVVLTSWKSTAHACCRSCGVRHQMKDLVASLILGWWGIPFGLVITPLQVARNVGGLLRPPDAARPSARLEERVRLVLAAEALGAARG